MNQEQLERERDDFKMRLSECQESRDATQAIRAELEVRVGVLTEALSEIIYLGQTEMSSEIVRMTRAIARAALKHVQEA